MPQRQLNIRSDEAADIASSLAKRLGRTTTDVVVDALRAYQAETEPRDEMGMTPRQRAGYEGLMAAAREVRKHIKPGMLLTDDDLYDEHGLPK